MKEFLTPSEDFRVEFCCKNFKIIKTSFLKEFLEEYIKRCTDKLVCSTNLSLNALLCTDTIVPFRSREAYEAKKRKLHLKD